MKERAQEYNKFLNNSQVSLIAHLPSKSHSYLAPFLIFLRIFAIMAFNQGKEAGHDQHSTTTSGDSHSPWVLDELASDEPWNEMLTSCIPFCTSCALARDL